MVHCATLFTLFLVTVAFARDNRNMRSCIPRPPTVPSGLSSPPASIPSGPSSSPTVLIPSGPSSSPVISYVTVTETITETKTINSCLSPGSPYTGNPTDTPKSLVESTPFPLPTPVNPPASPSSSPSPTSSYPNGDYIPSSLPISSSDEPGQSTPPALPTMLPSSIIANPPSPSSPVPIPSSSSSGSVVPSPASSAPQPTYTGKYDRNAICGNQKREPIEAAADFSKRSLHRKITH